MNVTRPIVQFTELATTTADPASNEAKDRLEEPTQAAADPIELEVVLESQEEIWANLKNRREADKSAAKQGTKWDLKSRSPNDMKIERALRDITEVNFNQQPLKEALIYLEELHNFKIILDLPTLTDAGLTGEESVNIVAAGISLNSMLNMMLKPLQLDYVIKNEMMVITTCEKAEDFFETRVYSLRHLPELTPQELLETITATVAPDRWERPLEVTVASQSEVTLSDNSDLKVSVQAVPPTKDAKTALIPPTGGGSSQVPLGSIRVTGKALVIRQTQRIHVEIVELLEQLKRATTEAKE